MTKIRVGLVFGGRSGEHEVSLQSAKSILEAIDRDRYDVVPIGIDKTGQWHLGEESSFLLHADDPVRIAINADSTTVLPTVSGGTGCLVETGSGNTLETIDVFFPVTHGTFGEDGSLQGLFRLAGVPYVGADVLGSAVAMDKAVMKRLLTQAGIPSAAFIVVRDWQRHDADWDTVRGHLGTPVFVKPCNMGSSVGISKVSSGGEYAQALGEAFRYDTKVIVEEGIQGREIECAVLGNDHPAASIPGEVHPTHDWYSYEAKYVDEHGAILHIPALLEPTVVTQVQAMAIEAFVALECAGMARVDFFLQEDGRLLVNEINTLPGFTKISMYPKLWEATGLPYRKLIDKLIELALARARRDATLVRTYV